MKKSAIHGQTIHTETFFLRTIFHFLEHCRAWASTSTYLLLTLLDFFCSWDETIGDYYYFNSDSGQTQWAHPLDEIYKQKVTLAREQFNNAEDKNQNNIVTDSNVAVSSDGDTSDVLSKSKMDKPLKLVSKKKNHNIWKIITYLYIKLISYRDHYLPLGAVNLVVPLVLKNWLL